MAYMVCLTDSLNGRPSICIADAGSLGLAECQSVAVKIMRFIQISELESHSPLIYLVMHPAKPFSGYLRSIILHVNMRRIFYPTIASIEIVIILKVFISVFVDANQSADF